MFQALLNYISSALQQKSMSGAYREQQRSIAEAEQFIQDQRLAIESQLRMMRKYYHPGLSAMVRAENIPAAPRRKAGGET